MAKFLSAAEEIFGKHGYEGTTIRAITKRARVNLGTLQHYWGSKRELFSYLFEQRFQQLKEEHLRRLSAIEERVADGSQPDVMEVVRALIEPTFLVGTEDKADAGREEAAADRKRFYALYGRALMDPAPDVVVELNRIFEESVTRWLDLMRRACPQLTVAELDWRVNCILGAQVFSLVYGERVGRFFGTDAQVDDATAARWVVHFLTHGIGSAPFSAGVPARPSRRTRAAAVRPAARAPRSTSTDG